MEKEIKEYDTNNQEVPICPYCGEKDDMQDDEENELIDLLQRQGEIDTNCPTCNKEYTLDLERRYLLSTYKKEVQRHRERIASGKYEETLPTGKDFESLYKEVKAQGERIKSLEFKSHYPKGKLLPCPFCGMAEISIKPTDDSHAYHIVCCKQCGVNLVAPTKEKAITKWNGRADEK